MIYCLWNVYATTNCALPWAINMDKPRRNNNKNVMYEWIISEICEAEKNGIQVNVCGIRYSSDDSQELYQVLEDAAYMEDYLSDEEGHIIQINFDKINQL